MRVSLKSFGRQKKAGVITACGSVTFKADTESEAVLLSMALSRLGSAESLLLIARLTHGGVSQIYTEEERALIGDTIDIAKDATAKEYERRMKEFR